LAGEGQRRGQVATTTLSRSQSSHNDSDVLNAWQELLAQEVDEERSKEGSFKKKGMGAGNEGPK